MASKRAAAFATKFEEKRQRTEKSLRITDNSELYLPVFSVEEETEEELKEYKKHESDNSDIEYLSAFNLGVNAS